MANEMFSKLVASFDIPDIKLQEVPQLQVKTVAAQVQNEFESFCKQCMSSQPFMNPSLTQHILSNLRDIASRHVNESNASYKQDMYINGFKPDPSMVCQYAYGICEDTDNLTFYARIFNDGDGSSCKISWEIPDTPNPHRNVHPEKPKPKPVEPKPVEKPINTPKYLPQYFTTEQLETLYKKSTQKWIYSPDTWNKKFDFVIDRERYIREVVARGGKLNLSAPIRYDDSFMEEVLKMSLYDVGELNSPLTWGSRRAQKKFKKCVLKYNMIEAIYRRLLKIQNVVLAFYHACDQHTLGVAFTTINRYHMAISLDDFLHVFYEPTSYKEKQVRGIYTWMPQIIPYIRFQLIDILELMGRSYYDFPCIQSENPFECWEDPLTTLYNAVYSQFKIIQKAFNVCETVPLNPNIVLTFLREYISTATNISNAEVLFKYKNTFYNHNAIETILLIDYLAGTIRSIGYIIDHPDVFDDAERICTLVALGDLYDAIVRAVSMYEELDPYILNKPGTVTWHRDLIHCGEFRMDTMNVYLAGKRSFLKKRTINPEKLYNHGSDYWKSLFTDFESKICESLTSGKIIFTL